MRMFIVALALSIACGCIDSPPALADTYIITLDSAARSEPATGRVILFFITEQGRRWTRREPIEAPFFESPQPIASIAVKDFKPGDSVQVDGSLPAFPQPLDKLSGTVRVQALLDADQTERSHEQGPGNVASEVMNVDLSADKHDTVRITLTRRIEGPAARTDSPNLKWVRLRSEMLSAFYGRDVYHRAGVALPKPYNDPNWPRQQWPAIYVIPGFGGRDDGAEEYAAMLTLAPKIEEIAPIAVYIVLDPEAPLGHHGFADSANNGPRATALVKEFIPYLESQFRLVAKPEARLVTGHSSGGWSSLWLQLNHPAVFGGCWSSAPDPIDFSAFQMTDLDRDANIFADGSGAETPSYRCIVDSTLVAKPTMTVRQEVSMETAIDPDGRCGQQWAAWNAMFSPRDPATGLPMPMFDARSGAINRNIVREWAQFDITKMVSEDWNRFGPIVLNKMHLACGEEDSYYLNRAVERFSAAVEKLRGEARGEGYVLLVPGANHDALTARIFMRWNDEMRKHLQWHGLQDADVPAKKSIR